jgi:hypothetical protein
MPGGDRTGPQGYGPRTGRGLGYCAGYPSPGFSRGVPAGWFGRGRGRGRGMGRGWWRGWYHPPYYQEDYPPQPASEPQPEIERVYLEETVQRLEDELASIRKRLDELRPE